MYAFTELYRYLAKSLRNDAAFSMDPWQGFRKSTLTDSRSMLRVEIMFDGAETPVDIRLSDKRYPQKRY
ncbi:hypothetical protein ANTRET_LOCUS4452 [Anthophora retusa]